MTARRALLLLATLVLLATLGLWLQPMVVSAQAEVRARVALPVDGHEVDVSPFLAGQESVRFVFSGSYDVGLDGSKVDALHRWSGSTLDTSLGPFLLLPAGARVVEQDAEIHRYVIEVPAGSHGIVALNLSPLARHYLVTPGELRASLRGAILLTVEALPATTTASSNIRGSNLPTYLTGSVFESNQLYFALAAGGLGMPLFVVALLGTFRRRQSPVRILMRRARRSVGSAEAEAERAGPAFAQVTARCHRLHEAAKEVARHHRSVRAAEKRTRHLSSQAARDRRTELSAQRANALHRLREIVERLEGTAARLANRAAYQDAPTNVEALLRGLEEETDTAVQADVEARA